MVKVKKFFRMFSVDFIDHFGISLSTMIRLHWLQLHATLSPCMPPSIATRYLIKIKNTTDDTNRGDTYYLSEHRHMSLENNSFIPLYNTLFQKQVPVFPEHQKTPNSVFVGISYDCEGFINSLKSIA